MGEIGRWKRRAVMERLWAAVETGKDVFININVEKSSYPQKMKRCVCVCKFFFRKKKK